MNDDIINELLSGDEPEETTHQGQREFKPKFNVREEFALWVREQFPELMEHAKKRRIYESLESRKDEVYQAALGAVNHGVASTEECATARLRYGWKEVEKGFRATADPKKRAKSLEAFVCAIEDLSISLGGNDHFTRHGRFLNSSSYGRYGNLNAFVYRVGEENGKDTEFLVYDTPQEFEVDQVPVLIGELTNLTEWNYKSLQRIASEFKGPESEFIDKVDREVPEDGVYLGSSSGSSGIRSTGSSATRISSGGYYGYK